jgi:translation initiation factor 2 subunit 2
VVDADGHVTMVAEPIDDSKDTAQSHTPRTPPLSAALGAFADASQAPGLDAAADGADDGLDLSLMKKKKKKAAKKTEDEEETPADDGAAAAGGDEAAAGDEEGALDLSLKKKKKKKTKESEDDFAKKLEALQLEGKEGEAPAAAETEEQDGDMDKGTGIWEHDEAKNIHYDPLLTRFFALLTQKNPDHASSGSKSYKIPPPQCLREGNKKTIFANIADICKRMKRTDEHVTAYLFSELGTSGSVDGSRRLVIKGRFQQKQIENVLRKYISKSSLGFRCSPATSLTSVFSRIRHMQDLPFARHRAKQGREPSVLHHLQLVRLAPFGPSHQDGFLSPDWQEKEDAGLGCSCSLSWKHLFPWDVVRGPAHKNVMGMWNGVCLET